MNSNGFFGGRIDRRLKVLNLVILLLSSLVLVFTFLCFMCEIQGCGQ